MSESLTIFGAPVLNRSCGGCTLCCTLVPVDDPELHKPAGVKCQHVRQKGCSIYAGRPDSCRYWSCRWLFDATTKDMRRPDHADYIVDPMPDTVLIDGDQVEVVQIWCKPKRRDAHRDPALRAWLQARRKPAIVRFNATESVLLVPPARSENGEWFESAHTTMMDRQAMAEKLADARGRE